MWVIDMIIFIGLKLRGQFFFLNQCCDLLTCAWARRRRRKNGLFMFSDGFLTEKKTTKNTYFFVFEKKSKSSIFAKKTKFSSWLRLGPPHPLSRNQTHFVKKQTHFVKNQTQYCFSWNWNFNLSAHYQEKHPHTAMTERDDRVSKELTTDYAKKVFWRTPNRKRVTRSVPRRLLQNQRK